MPIKGALADHDRRGIGITGGEGQHDRVGRRAIPKNPRTAIPDRWPGRRTKAARFDGRAFFPERTAARPAALAPIG